MKKDTELDYTGPVTITCSAHKKVRKNSVLTKIQANNFTRYKIGLFLLFMKNFEKKIKFKSYPCNDFSRFLKNGIRLLPWDILVNISHDKELNRPLIDITFHLLRLYHVLIKLTH